MKPVSDFLLIERINQCPKLASLQSINETLATLLDSDESLLHQVAEVIRLDPSLTTRVLDLVNSIFFGSDHDDKITGIEEASIFLGLNRIRELLSTTPIIEEIADLGNGNASITPYFGDSKILFTAMIHCGHQTTWRANFFETFYRVNGGSWTQFYGGFGSSLYSDTNAMSQTIKCSYLLSPSYSAGNQIDFCTIFLVLR